MVDHPGASEAVLPVQPHKEPPKLKPESNNRSLLERKKFGRYFIDRKLIENEHQKKLINDLFEGKNLNQEKTEKELEIRRKAKARHKRYATPLVEMRRREEEIEFSGYVRKHNEQVFKSRSGTFVDTLSAGIFFEEYRLLDTPAKQKIEEGDFSELLKTDEYKTAYRSTLIGLGKKSRENFGDPEKSKQEILVLQRYLRGHSLMAQEVENIQSWKDKFEYLANAYPENFLGSYFNDFRFMYEEGPGLAGLFQVGQEAVTTLAEVRAAARKDKPSLDNFLSYEAKEKRFKGERYWFTKLNSGINDNSTTRSVVEKSLTPKKTVKGRSFETMEEMGLPQDSEFLEAFHGLDLISQGMLFSVRGELGFGTLAPSEVKNNAENYLASARKLAGETLAEFMTANFKDYYADVAYMAFKGYLGPKMQSDYQRIFKGEAWNKDLFDIENQQGDFAIRAVNFADFKLMFRDLLLRDPSVLTDFTNQKNIDGFGLGVTLGDLIKDTAREKASEDKKASNTLNEHIAKEENSFKFLSEGEIKNDPKVKERVEKAFEKTSHLERFKQKLLKYADSAGTKVRNASQKAMFYPEGESPFMAESTPGSETKAIVISTLLTALGGHAVNYFLEGPVNRGLEFMAWMVLYGGYKEASALMKEIKARQRHATRSKFEWRKFPESTKHLAGYLAKEKFLYRAESAWKNKGELTKSLWHNKIKYGLSMGSYYITALGINGIFQFLGAHAPGIMDPSAVPAMMMAANTAAYAVISGAGGRMGVDTMINFRFNKSTLDRGVEMLMGKNFDVPVNPFSQLSEALGSSQRKGLKGGLIRLGAKAAKNLEKRSWKSLTFQQMTGTEEGSVDKLMLLRKFLVAKDNPKISMTDLELIHLAKFLNWLKDEQATYIIHNPTFYGRRKIRTQNGKSELLDNKQALKDIDNMRAELLHYAQANMPRQDYQDMLDVLQRVDTDVKSMRAKVWLRRRKYIIASLGYKVAFTGLSYLAANSPALHEPMNAIFGSDTRRPETMIQALQAPSTEVYQFNSSDHASAANEVAARFYELNNLIILINSDTNNGAGQILVSNNASYNGLTGAQLLQFQKSLGNFSSADLMRVIYDLSTFKEGQDSLAGLAAAMNGTDHKDLTPLVEYFLKNNPQLFMETAVKDHHLAALISINNADLAGKLKLPPMNLADQLSLFNLTADQQKEAVSSAVSAPFDVTTSDGHRQTLAVVGDVVAGFVDKLPAAQRNWDKLFLMQFHTIFQTDNTTLEQAVNHHFAAFLADSNSSMNGFVNPTGPLSMSDIQNSPNLSHDSLIYKIFSSFPSFEQTGHLVDLINQAKNGDAASYNELYQLLLRESARNPNINPEQMFNAANGAGIYDNILINIPQDQALAHSEMLSKIKPFMLQMGMAPVNGPVLNSDSILKLNIDPTLFTDPQFAYSYALTHQVADLNQLVQTKFGQTQFIMQNGNIVGVYHPNFYTDAQISPLNVAMLQSIEGQESQNDPKVLFPTLIYRNILGKGPLSGGSTPAVTLFGWLTEGSAHMLLDPNIPSANKESMFHNYSKYGVDYLIKLVMADVRGRIPNELAARMAPTMNLQPEKYNESHSKIKQLIDMLCFKMENYIAATQLDKNFGQNTIDETYIKNFYGSTVNGIDIRGAGAISQVLFGKSWESLNAGQQYLIISLGQSPMGYLFDYQNGQYVADPQRALDHALANIQSPKIGGKLDSIVGNNSDRARILHDLLNMQSQMTADTKTNQDPKVWGKVFTGGLELPKEVQNVSTPQTIGVEGLTGSQLQEQVKAGNVKSVTKIADGILITLKDAAATPENKIIPSQVIFPAPLPADKQAQGLIDLFYAGAFAEGTLHGNFYTINTPEGPIQVPAWHAGAVTVPGMAMVEYSGDYNAVVVDPTNELSKHPQLFGSTFKPLFTLWALTHHPEYMQPDIDPKTGFDPKLNFAPTTVGGIAVSNSTTITDMAGPHTVNYALAASANVPMAELWNRLIGQDPKAWADFQNFAHQFGIYFYEVKGGNYVPMDHIPTVDAGYGNIYVGGAKPTDSGLVQMAHFYYDLGVLALKGQGDPKQVAAAKYIFDALHNTAYKQGPTGIDIWSLNNIKDITMDNGFTKTGTQSMMGPNGQWIAGRVATFGAKLDPETGKVIAFLVYAGGRDVNGNPVELTWGSEEALPIQAEMIRAMGSSSSSDLVMQALNTVYMGGGGSYGLGAVSVNELFPYVKDFAPGRYAELSDSIMRGHTSSLFVDLVGPVHSNGATDVQTVALHVTNAAGQNNLISFDVPAGFITHINAGDVAQFYDNSAQKVIYSMLAEASKSDPAKYAGLLANLQSQGVNIVPISASETSPLLFTLHEQMKKNNFLLMGPEDAAKIMKEMGFDPQKTVFVNADLLKLYTGNPYDPTYGHLTADSHTVLDQLAAERNFMSLEKMFDVGIAQMPAADQAQFGSGLDQFLYSNGVSNQTYDLLRIFVDAHSSQSMVQGSSERLFLIQQFDNLMNNPEKAKLFAPNIWAAYSDFTYLQDKINHGIPLDSASAARAADMISQLQKVQSNTDYRVLALLGLNEHQTAAANNFTPVDVLSATPASSEAVFSSDRVISFLQDIVKHPNLYNATKANATLIKAAIDVVQASKSSANAADFTAQLKAMGINTDNLSSAIAEFNNTKQCVNGFVLINKILFNANVGVPDMQGLGKGQAIDFIAPLANASRHHGIGDPLVVNGLTQQASVGHNLLYEYVNQIQQVQSGDTMVLRFRWLDTPSHNDPGHILYVLYSGYDQNHNPELIIFDTNANGDGVSQIRTITSMDQLVPMVAKEAAPKFAYANGNLPQPEFAIIRPVSDSVPISN